MDIREEVNEGDGESDQPVMDILGEVFEVDRESDQPVMDILGEVFAVDGESRQSSVESDWKSQQPLMEAAKVGDVSFLRKAYADNVGDLESYFLGRTVKEIMSYPKDIVSRVLYRGHSYRNILHKAVKSDQYSFLWEAMEILKSHPTLIIHLISQTNKWGLNSLHYAVKRGNIYVVKLLVHAYVTAVASDETCQETLMPPWLWLNSVGQTPLHSCFVNASSNEGIAMYLVLQDQRLGQDRYPPKHECSTQILHDQKRSVVFKAMQAGWSLLVEHILNSDLPYKLDGSDDERKRVTPLHYASKCNAKVSKRLLEKHPELINVPSVESVLHVAVQDGATWLVKLMLVGDKTPVPTWIKDCRRLMWHINNRGETPLHISARHGSTEIAELIIQAYYSTLQDEATTWDADVEARPEIPDMGVNLLCMKNSDREVPVLVALRNKHDKCGVILSKQTIPLCEFGNGDIVWDALLEAVNTGCRQSIKTIIALLFAPGSFYVIDLSSRPEMRILTTAVGKIFEYLTHKCEDKNELLKSEEMEKLSEVLPDFLKEPVKDGKTLMIKAAERGEDWLVKLVLDSDNSLKEESAPAWQAACKKGHISILFTIISKFGDQGFIRHCQKSKQTPLHHIKLKQYGEYVKLLEKPVLEKIKNEIDSDGATPLHRAIQSDNLELTKALLEIKGIEVNIKNKHGTTAFDLLENRCIISKNWGKMCREIERDSTVKKLKYLFRRIAFDGMQNTLSVVAALVATITFAAGITMPGGVDSNDGTAVLSTTTAFLVFSISNTIAMCSSTMVLFLLLGPMMWDPPPSLFHVNLSLFLLLLSLGGTTLAFMTGVYATMLLKVKWNAIFVMVSCSLTLFVGCIVLLSTYLPLFKNKVPILFDWPKQVIRAFRFQSTSSVPPDDDPKSETVNAMETQVSSSSLQAAPELGQGQTENKSWETGQASGASDTTSDDIKIDIKAS